jgi:hypothetical protein
MNMEVVIPTRNGARWLRQFLLAYRKLGIEPLYIVDSRSEDETERLLRSEGARGLVFDATADFVEGGTLEFVSQRVEQNWIMRIDDDEFPSCELIHWARKTGCEADVDCWGLSRRNLFNCDHPIKYSQIETQFHTHPRIVDIQQRLYRHKRVIYERKLHQAGFSCARSGHAPPDAFLIHCDLLLRSVGQRVEKLRQYERMQEGSSWKYAYHYLPELFPKVDQRPTLLDTHEFDALLASLPRPQPTPTQLTSKERNAIRHATRAFTKSVRQQWQPAIQRPWPLLTLFANKTLAEFVCTIAKTIRSVEARFPQGMRIANSLHKLGSDLYQASQNKEPQIPRGEDSR